VAVGHLRIADRTGWLLVGPLAVADTAEVACVSLQRWRGVAFHINNGTIRLAHAAELGDRVAKPPVFRPPTGSVRPVKPPASPTQVRILALPHCAPCDNRDLAVEKPHRLPPFLLGRCLQQAGFTQDGSMPFEGHPASGYIP
jgi:hypothetical protein